MGWMNPGDHRRRPFEAMEDQRSFQNGYQYKYTRFNSTSRFRILEVSGVQSYNRNNAGHCVRAGLLPYDKQTTRTPHPLRSTVWIVVNRPRTRRTRKGQSRGLVSEAEPPGKSAHCGQRRRRREWINERIDAVLVRCTRLTPGLR